MDLFLSILNLALFAFLLLLLARLVLEWVQLFARDWRPSGFMLVVAEIVYSITDPPLRALRAVIPPLRLGGIQLDLGFLVLIILVQVALSLTR